MATILDGAGYTTALIGKYMNSYPATGTYYKPPGWDGFYLMAAAGKDTNNIPNAQYNYTIWTNNKFIVHGNSRPPGTPFVKAQVSRGVSDYMTDDFSRRVEKTIRGNPASPLFLYVAPYSPHWPYTPAKTYANTPVGYVKTPSFGEADLGDKSAWTRLRMPVLTPASLKNLNQQQIQQRRMMRSVDDLIVRALVALRDTGRLANAYVIVTTDNGYMAGEHRMLEGKGYPYTEALRATLLIAGPGVAKGATRTDMIANIDLLPTFAEMAGVPTPSFVDGRSFLPQAQGGPASARKHIAVEMLSGGPPGFGQFQGFKTQTSSYAHMLVTDEHEAYDLRSDPNQMQGIWPTLRPDAKGAVLAKSAELARCSRQSCRDAEDGALVEIED